MHHNVTSWSTSWHVILVGVLFLLYVVSFTLVQPILLHRTHINETQILLKCNQSYKSQCWTNKTPVSNGIPCASLLFPWTSHHQLELDGTGSLVSQFYFLTDRNITRVIFLKSSQTLTVVKFTSVACVIFSGSNSVRINGEVSSMGLGFFNQTSQLRQAICHSFCMQLGNREDI